MARFHLEKCCSVTVFVLFLVCCVLGEFQYPDVPRNESLEEDYFGTIVSILKYQVLVGLKFVTNFVFDSLKGERPISLARRCKL